MAAEAEHGEGDQGVGRCESERDAGHESDLGVHSTRPLESPCSIDAQAFAERRRRFPELFGDDAAPDSSAPGQPRALGDL